MKSGIVTRSDPYLMDPSILVDPNLILDYGSSVKGTSADSVNAVFCQVPSFNDLTGRSILDEALFDYPSNDPWLDLIQCNDTQLENIILDSGLSLCGVECDIGTITSSASLGYTGNDWSDNEFDLDEVLKGLNSQLESNGQVTVKPEPSSTFKLAVSDIANFEEVATTDALDSTSEDSKSMDSEDAFEEGGNTTDDLDSVHSFSTQASELPRSTRLACKRKISTESVESSISEDYVAPKRRKAAARRNKRVQDERVKKQNKLAAMKYRKKKRDEKMSLDDVLKMEEERNKTLKDSVSGLTVEVQVLKELLGKYLTPGQMKPSKR